MSTFRFADPTLTVARDRLTRLMAAYASATGFSVAFVGLITKGERKFALEYRKRDFKHGTYDLIAGRLSALWPEDLAWPEDIPRLAPAELPDEVIQAVAERRATLAGVPKSLPSGDPWPEDIPRPDAPIIPTHEVQNG